jgi:hypothetical protein
MVRMLLQSRTLIGNTSLNTMSNFQRRHYTFIADLLAMTGANEQQIATWVKALQRDNPRFNENRFLQYIEDTRAVIV